MIVYICGTTLSILFAYVAVHIGRSNQIQPAGRWLLPKAFALLSVVPLTFIMAVRRSVGTDYWSYWNMFRSNRGFNEKGYELLNWVLRYFFESPQSIFVACAIIICGSYYFFIYRESINPMYSILLFVICKDYFIAMNGMRQYVASAILICSIPFIKERKWIPSFLIILLASYFHRSSLIYLLFFALHILTVPPIAVGCIIVICFLSSGALKNFVLPIFERYSFYSLYFERTHVLSEGYINWMYFLVFLSFFLLLAYEYKRVKHNEKLKLLYTAVIMSLFLLSLGAYMPSNFHRLTWYMNVFIVLYVPEATKLITDKKLGKIVNVAIVVLYTFITLRDITFAHNQDVLPYRAFWMR